MRLERALKKKKRRKLGHKKKKRPQRYIKSFWFRDRKRGRAGGRTGGRGRKWNLLGISMKAKRKSISHGVVANVSLNETDLADLADRRFSDLRRVVRDDVLLWRHEYQPRNISFLSEKIWWPRGPRKFSSKRPTIRKVNPALSIKKKKKRFLVWGDFDVTVMLLLHLWNVRLLKN